MILNRARALKAAGVLGINQRNAHFTLIRNDRARYPLVDDKLRTKRLAEAAGLAVPELFGVIASHGDVRKLAEIIAPHRSFVIKPAHGSGGQGILVLDRGPHGLYRKPAGDFIDARELAYHINNILSGIYSLGGQPDAAMIEYRVAFDPALSKISFAGVPDIRIVVYRGVPVMAMVRLPTRRSEGRANLHQGAIGAGIDIARGVTLTAVADNRVIDEHPDTAEPVTGIAIPHWDEMLRLAAGSWELTGLGYQGVDIVLDRDKGPLLLEINARPGLNIQIANGAGLVPRLAAVDAHIGGLASIEDRIAYARRQFGTGLTAPSGQTD